MSEFNEVIIQFLTTLLGVAAHDIALYSDEEYKAIKKFINNEIEKLRK